MGEDFSKYVLLSTNTWLSLKCWHQNFQCVLLVGLLFNKSSLPQGTPKYINLGYPQIYKYEVLKENEKMGAKIGLPFLSNVTLQSNNIT